MKKSRAINPIAGACLLAALLSGGCANNEPAASGEFPPPRMPEEQKPTERAKPRIFDNSIRVGDSIEIFVKEDNRFDRIYLVREQGDIIIPEVGRIPIAGLSVTAAGAKIEAALERSQLTEATLMVDRVKRAKVEPDEVPGNDPRKNARKIIVYMTGKVNRPGQHILTLPEDRPVGVYEAILITGGLHRFGNEQKVHVLRMDDDGKRHKIPINVRLIESGKEVDPPIGHGDVVVVPEKVFGY